MGIVVRRRPGDRGSEPVRFGRDDESVYFVCPGDSGVGGVCRWDVATRTMQTLWSGRIPSRSNCSTHWTAATPSRFVR
jgi:hypothetical protein